MDYKKSQFCKKKKKNENAVPFQNGGQITDFYFASFRFWPKFEKKKKNTFPKEFFNEIWLKVGKHEYIYWNNIFKKWIRFKMKAKTIFWYCAIMLIYAN